MADVADAFPLSPNAPTSMWRYEALLPLLGDESITIGEGWTELVPATELSTELDIDVYLKNETTNRPGRTRIG